MDIEAWLSSNFPDLSVEQGQPARTSADGLVYDVVANGGFKPEGGLYPSLADTPEAAWSEYLGSLAEFIGSARRLVWRDPPQLRAMGEDGSEFAGKFVIRSRLAVA